MVNYFELYEIPQSFNPDPAVVKAKYYELSRLHHPDRFSMAEVEEQAVALQLSSANNQAWKTLNNPDATMAYVLKEEGMLEDEEKYNLPPDFLMEMMELNELLDDDAGDAGNETLSSAGNMLDAMLQQWEEDTRPLTRKYDNGDHSRLLLGQIKEQYFRKKYLLRIQERMNSFASR